MRIRADALLLALLTLAAGGMARAYLRRHAMGNGVTRTTWLAAVGIVLAGALLAEETAVFLGYPAPGTLLTVVVVRAVVLGGAAILILALGAHVVQIGGLHAQLRAHADTDRELQRAKVAADDANRAKSDFLAVMSHEIRTPLNAVMGFANLLSDTRLDDAQRGYLGTITSEGARLGSLINDILDLAKIEEGRLVLERLPFAPAETAHEVLRLLSVRALEKKLDLRLEAQLAGPLVVAGDPLRFRQVLVNLVDNAVKFTTRGSVTVFISWSTEASMPGGAASGRLTVRVRDTGIGIAEEKLKDLFRMFMQVDTSTTRRFGGTGLGLAICQRLVLLMGGEITVTSKHREGSEFTFSLPMAQVGLPTATEPAEAEPTVPCAQTPRVLVVDDMETNRFLLETFLQRNGFSADLAASGEEAVRLATANHYDVILMDLQMPEVDGYTAAKRIRAAESPDRRTLIIALTATVTKGTREKCLEAGMDEHLTKPLDLRRFKSVLHSLLARTS